MSPPVRIGMKKPKVILEGKLTSWVDYDEYSLDLDNESLESLIPASLLVEKSRVRPVNPMFPDDPEDIRTAVHSEGGHTDYGGVRITIERI